MPNELKESIKEGLRVAVLSAIPIIIDGLTNGQVDLKLVGIAVAVSVLRWLDAFLHETGTAERGLTRF